MKYKSRKIGKNLYEVSIPKRRIAINVIDSLNIVEHKGRWIVALAQERGAYGRRTFAANQTINRTQALNIISFLVDYVNLVKPTEATSLQASIKASTNRTIKSTKELVGIAVRSEEND